MKHRKAEIAYAPANAMCRDLGVKFREDHIALITRTLKIMVPEIGPGYSTSIILSVLANSGLALAKAADLGSDDFMAIVAAAAEEKL